MISAQEKRETSKQLMLSRKGKNSYTQARPVYFWGHPASGKEPGRSDCSGSVAEVLKRAAGVSIGGNTSAQIDNRKNGTVVDQTDGYYPDESKLKVGDCLYFKGNTSHSLDVGHVEMYIGNNQCIGHGSGMGPTVKNLRNYCKSRASTQKRYFIAIRWIRDDASGKPPKLGDRPLSRGMIASDVGELQMHLKKLRYDIGKSGSAKDGVDCDYGALTAKAVKSIQAACKLSQTGDADLITTQTIIAGANGKPMPTAKQRVRVTGGSVYVRTGPSTRHKAIASVHSRDVFDATGDARDGWLGIMFKGEPAWISAKYAEVIS